MSDPSLNWMENIKQRIDNELNLVFDSIPSFTEFMSTPIHMHDEDACNAARENYLKLKIDMKQLQKQNNELKLQNEKLRMTVINLVKLIGDGSKALNEDCVELLKKLK